MLRFRYGLIIGRGVKMKINDFLKALIVILVLVFSLGNMGNVNASENVYFDLEEIIVEKNVNSIALNWNEIEGAHKYIIRYEDKIIYEGIENKYKHEELSEGSVNEYYIIALDENELVIDNVYLKIFTSITTNGNEYEDIGVDAISNQNSILLIWPSIENNENYDVYKNEELLGTTTNNLFLDDKLNYNTEYEYSIKTKVRITESEIKKIRDEAIESYDKMIRDEFTDMEGEELTIASEQAFEELNKEILELEKNPYHYIEISTPVKTMVNNKVGENFKMFEQSIMKSSKALPANTSIRINTMILNKTSGPTKDRKYFKQPGRNYYFATDNRTSIGSGGSTRSKLTASIKWSNRSVTESKSIGPTKRYTKNSKGNYVYKDTKTASSNGVYFGVTKKTKSMVDINFKHSAKNPFTTIAPSIKYDFRSEIYRDGTTKMKGYHTMFPSMGIYRNDGSGYKRLYSYNQGTRTPFSLFATKTINIVK